jgi:hypothetical protein
MIFASFWKSIEISLITYGVYGSFSALEVDFFWKCSAKRKARIVLFCTYDTSLTACLLLAVQQL